MKTLYIKGKLLTIFGKYDITDEGGNTVFSVQGDPALGIKLEIADASGKKVGEIRQRLMHMAATFDIKHGDKTVGSVKREFSVLKTKYNVDFRNWEVVGDMLEWDIRIIDSSGNSVARSWKQVLHLTDHYVIEVMNDEDILDAVMVVLTISSLNRELNEENDAARAGRDIFKNK